MGEIMLSGEQMRLAGRSSKGEVIVSSLSNYRATNYTPVYLEDEEDKLLPETNASPMSSYGTPPPHGVIVKKKNACHTLLLTKSSQSLPELVLVDEARVVPVVGTEDVLPVGDVLPHAGELVEVHPAFVLTVEHGCRGTVMAVVLKKKKNQKDDLPKEVGVILRLASGGENIEQRTQRG